MSDILENKETESNGNASVERKAEKIQYEPAALQELQKRAEAAEEAAQETRTVAGKEAGYGHWFDATGDREEAQRLAVQSRETAQSFLYGKMADRQLSEGKDSSIEEDKVEDSGTSMERSEREVRWVKTPYGSLIQQLNHEKTGIGSEKKVMDSQPFWNRKNKARKKKRRLFIVITVLLLCIALVLSMFQGLLLLILTGASGGWSSLEVGRRTYNVASDGCADGCNCLDTYLDGSSGDGVAGLQPGDTIEEIIWNTLVAANIPKISDNPSAIAGIMGNIIAESGMCPFKLELNGNGGLGLVQWTNPGGGTTGRRAELENFMYTVKKIDRTAFENEMHTYKVKCNHPDDLWKQVFVVQMEYVLYELLHTEPLFLSKFDLVTGKTGVKGAESYAELFCVTYERPGENAANATIVNDPDIFAYAQSKGRQSGKYNGIAERREQAAEIFKQFALSGSTNTTDVTSSTISTGITFIGGTIGVSLEGTLRSSLGSLSYIDSVDSRTVVEGKAVLDSLGTTPNLKNLVVLELGTYGPCVDDILTLESIVSVLTDKTVVLVTPYMSSTYVDYAAAGAIVESTTEWIRNVPSVYSNVKIADWALLAKSNESLLSDGLNLTPTAYETYVNLILDALGVKASAGSVISKRIVCNCSPECACWKVHGQNVITGEGSQDYAEDYVLGVLPVISADPPDSAAFDALTIRQKIVYAAKWYYENGKDVYFYSQHNTVRTLPEDILLSPWKIINGKAFDCSGFASSMYKLAGLDINLDTDSMNSDDRLTKISWKTAKPGDLLLTNSKGHVIIILSVDVANKKMEIVESGGAGSAYINKTVKLPGDNFPTLKLRWVDIKPVMLNGVEHKTDITLDNDTSRVYSVRVHNGAD